MCNHKILIFSTIRIMAENCEFLHEKYVRNEIRNSQPLCEKQSVSKTTLLLSELSV